MKLERYIAAADTLRQQVEWYLRYRHLLDAEDAATVARTLRRAAYLLLQAAHELESGHPSSPNPSLGSDADSEDESASLSLLALLAEAVRQLPGTFLVFPTVQSLLDNLAAARDYAEGLLEERRELAAAWADGDEERLRELLDLVRLAVTT